MAGRRVFKRKEGFRPRKKLFVISTEGHETEPIYFSIFNNEKVQIVPLNARGKGSTYKVLNRAREYLKENRLEQGDELWLVVDKDENSSDQLQELLDFTKDKENHDLAVSNPRFEYWLLLHFEDGTGVNKANCNEKLRKHLPNYEKSRLDVKKLESGIMDAIRRAKQKHIPEKLKWPDNTGSTVYRLVEKLIDIK